MEAAIYFLLLPASLYAISKASDWFIDSAVGLGTKLHLKDYLIGSLIIGIGTSLPELVTSISAVLQKQPVLVSLTSDDNTKSLLGKWLSRPQFSLAHHLAHSTR